VPEAHAGAYGRRAMPCKNKREISSKRKASKKKSPFKNKRLKLMPLLQKSKAKIRKRERNENQTKTSKKRGKLTDYKPIYLMGGKEPQRNSLGETSPTEEMKNDRAGIKKNTGTTLSLS